MNFSKPTLISLLAFAALSCGVQAAELGEKGFVCGTKYTKGEEAVGRLRREFAPTAEVFRRNGVPVEIAPISVDVYVHVVSTPGIKPAKGPVVGIDSIDDTVVRNQVAVLNDSFKPANISFTFKETDKTSYDNWDFANFATHELNLKKKLHKGSKTALNLYIIQYLGENKGGMCNAPWGLNQTDGLVLDGCFIDSRTVPGGPMATNNQGKIAVHEVGHWLGLLHTFQGGCDGDGDQVDDTPAHTSRFIGCTAEGLDTCPQPGIDPVHNYMAYNGDECSTEFTKGQIDRMHSMWQTYRL